MTIQRLASAILLRLSLFHASAQREMGFICWLNSFTAFPLLRAMSGSSSLVRDTRVEEPVHDIDHEVHGDEYQRIHDDFTHDEGVVPVDGRLDEYPADAGNGEDGLDDEGARDDAREGR